MWMPLVDWLRIWKLQLRSVLLTSLPQCVCACVMQLVRKHDNCDLLLAMMLKWRSLPCCHPQISSQQHYRMTGKSHIQLICSFLEENWIVYECHNLWRFMNEICLPLSFWVFNYIMHNILCVKCDLVSFAQSTAYINCTLFMRTFFQIWGLLDLWTFRK